MASLLWASANNKICHWRKLRYPIPLGRWRPSHLFEFFVEATPLAKQPFEWSFSNQTFEHISGFASPSHLKFTLSIFCDCTESTTQMPSTIFAYSIRNANHWQSDLHLMKPIHITYFFLVKHANYHALLVRHQIWSVWYLNCQII